MNIFGSKTPAVMGLDISSTAVKLIQFSRGGDGAYRVEHFAIEPIAEGMMVEKHIEDVEGVSAAIKRAVKRSGSRARHCAVAVSGSAVITKNITLPSDLSDSELEAQIEIEANQYVPYELDEVSLDFEVLGPSIRNPDMVDIVLAASKTENIELRQDAVEAAGLKTKVVDVEAFTIGNAFELIRRRDGIPDSQIQGIVDIGANMTSLIVLRGDQVIYVREHTFGGKQLVEDVIRRYGMTPEQALFFQRDEEAPENFRRDVLEPFQQNIVQQISRSLQFYSSSSNYADIGAIYLSGGCARIPGLDQVVADELGIKTAIADPVSGLSYSNSVAVNSLRRNAPALMVASGLGLRGYD